MQVVRFMRSTLALGILVGLVLIPSAIALAGGPTYTATDLGALGTGISQANAVNSSGQVVGYSETSSGLYDGFSWASGPLLDLGALVTGQFSFAYGINDSGLIVGAASDLTGSYHAILWQNGQMTQLPFLAGGSQAVAMAINNGGTIAGYAYDSSGNSHAVIWQPGSGGYTITDLGTFSGVQSAAYAINTHGAVTGYYVDSSGNDHAFLWQSGMETDLGDLGGGLSYGQAINSSGVVVGQAMTSGGDWHAFSWQSGQMTDLGALDGVMSSANGINDSSVIVGQSSSPDGTDHAVLWQGGQIVDLGSYVGLNSVAYAINASGQIVGQGNLGSSTHAFLLTPQAASPSGTPPVTTASLSGPTENDSGWYTGSVTVTLTATATGGASVANTYYTIDGGSQETYSGPFTISGDGTHTFTFWSVDTSGDTESAHSQTVEIDSTEPVTTASLAGTLGNDGWYITPVTVTLSAQDATSGVAETLYRLNCDTRKTYTQPITISWSGCHRLRFRSIDVAGNKEQAQHVQIKIDTLPPMIGADGYARSLGSGTWLVTISGFAFDCISGLTSDMPAMTLSDSLGAVSASSMTRCGCCGFFEIQFKVKSPSTAANTLNVNLSVQDRAGLSSSDTVHVGI